MTGTAGLLFLIVSHLVTCKNYFFSRRLSSLYFHMKDLLRRIHTFEIISEFQRTYPFDLPAMILEILHRRILSPQLDSTPDYGVSERCLAIRFAHVGTACISHTSLSLRIVRQYIRSSIQHS
jgi:hypothetical protein